MTDLLVVSVIGNPRPGSRTHRLAQVLGDEIATALGGARRASVDLASLGPGVLDPDDAPARGAVAQILRADILVLASPTYKATYSGLLKAFLDRIGTGALAGTAAVPLLLGGAPNHQLAVDVHFTPLLFELGAAVPARGLFVLESELEAFADTARAWARDHAPALSGVIGRPNSEPRPLRRESRGRADGHRGLGLARAARRRHRVGVPAARGPGQRVIQDSGLSASVAIRRGRCEPARSASVTPSSTERTFVRSAIHTSCSGAAAAV